MIHSPLTASSPFAAAVPDEEERLVQAIVDALPAHVCVLDEAGRIVVVNAAWRAFAEANGRTGVASRDVGVNYAELCLDASRAGAAGADLFADGTLAVLSGRVAEYCQEYECHGPNEQRWFLGRVTPMRTHRGAWAVVAHETITARKQAELAVQRIADLRLERYRLLSEHTRDVVLFVRRADGRIIEANETALRVYGCTRDALLAKTIYDLRGEATQAAVAHQMDVASAAGVLFETVHRRHDGSEFPVEVSSSGLTINDERILLSIVRDISERRTAEDELHRSQQMLQLVLDHIPEGVFWKGPDLRYEGCNVTTAAQAGLASPEDIVGKTDFDLAWFDNAPDYQAGDRTVLTSGVATIDVEETIPESDGTVRFVHTSKIPLRDRDGHIVGVLGTYADVTDRRRAEAEREHLIVELNAALASVRTLRGFIPICASCKKIRDDEGYWHAVEVYVRDHTEATFSHGVCPDCLVRLYPEFHRGAPPELP